jgi:thiamine-monophosphate kinase
VQLRRVGEWKVIELLKRKYSRRVSAVPIGIGDDTAMIRPAAGRQLLITTDLLVEGVDFDLAWTDFRQIGHKAMAANLSDMASMGGIPRYALVGAAFPGKTSFEAVRSIYRGLNDLGRRYGVLLIGGDTSASPRHIMVAVTLIGEIDRPEVIRRSGSRPGDRIFVTGSLGEARAGLEILKRRRRRGRLSRANLALVRRQLFPIPRIREARLLAGRRLATSMIDISDGLSSDLHHLCASGGVGAEIDLARLPLSKALRDYANKAGTDPHRYALDGGEEFELLFTVRPSRTGEIGKLRASGKLRAVMIGEITQKRAGVTLRDLRHRRKRLVARGYEHFILKR